ncbi:MAG TPA: protease pro-enzyme activation domain-containing protein [Verrucomicrobiae bacterium]|nr:protease pro-enzyme activation domain-containing protein [Verrucomicrobiae bacterium]
MANMSNVSPKTGRERWLVGNVADMPTQHMVHARWFLKVARRRIAGGFDAVAGAIVFLLLVTLVQAAQRQALSGHVPQAVKSFARRPIQRVPGTNVLHLAIGVPLHDPDGARAFLQELYDPTSPVFHQYLTPEQFTEKFGPTEDDYEQVIAFATANGFQVTGADPDRLLLDVRATAADIERAFQVRLFEYQHPGEARTFYAPDVEPSVPSGLKIVDVSGLSNFARPHPNSHRGGELAAASVPRPDSGSALGGQYRGYDFRAAYVPGTPLTGVGQSVALVQFDGYYASDITRYQSLAGLPRPYRDEYPAGWIQRCPHHRHSQWQR